MRVNIDVDNLHLLTDMLLWQVYETGGLRPGTTAECYNSFVDTLVFVFGQDVGAQMAEMYGGRTQMREQDVRTLDRRFKHGEGAEQ